MNVSILCRSREQSKKEEGITQRFEKKIADAPTRMKAHCERQKRDPMTFERDVGKRPRQNTRTAKLFDVKGNFNSCDVSEYSCRVECNSDCKYINQMVRNPSAKEQADHRCGQNGDLKINHRKAFCCSFHESETNGS